MAPTHASRTVAGRRDRDDSQGKDKAANLSAPSRAKLEKAFALFDTDNDGYISVDELTAILSRNAKGGSELARENARSLMKLYDQSNDMKLNVKEFITFLLHTEPLRKSLRLPSA